MSDSNRAILAFQRETTWGTNPASVALKKARFTKETLMHEKTTVRSGEIREDRQQSEELEVGVSAKGGFDFELSVGDFDLFLESALQSSFSGGILRNGSTKTSFILEKKIADAAFILFGGMMIDQFTLNLNSQQIVTGQLTFMGKSGAISATSADGSGYTDAGTGLILTSSVNAANILEGGAALAECRSITLTTQNNLRSNPVIGQKTPLEIGVGSFAVTGKMNCYFKTKALLEKFFNHTLTSLSFELSREHSGAATGDHIGYRFTIPAIRLTKETPQIPGKDADIFLDLDFAAEASAAVKASGTLTLSTNLSNDDTVVVAGKTYTAKSSLTNTDGFFHIGATASDTIDNLIAAITLGAGSGTAYAAATTANPSATASAGSGDTMTVTALVAGTAGNAITTTEASSHAAFGAATLSGGVDSYSIQIERILKA